MKRIASMRMRWRGSAPPRLLALGFLATAFGAAAEPSVAAPVRGNDGVLVQLTAGTFDAVRQVDLATELGIQLRWRPRRFGLRPTAGLAATDDRAWYGYLGLARDVPLGRRWLLSPHFAASFYEHGDGKDLGHALEFLSGLELGYTLANGTRVGLAFRHLSNSSLSDRNPGTELILLTYAWDVAQPRGPAHK